ncbi:nitrilase-related carbon-nitrogen hydrolase [Candidatus Poriferisocius sp.]|uniref:nitrilase-related carbon-nitrogen hydrolase n=1 Tax=Candidatus Poriferisocius sp. TaxID=3101276 RepID=UPI003B5C47EB
MTAGIAGKIASDFRSKIRVAVGQMATGWDTEENLATCLRMVDEAAAEGADLVVLPEFCNHPSVYESAAHCRAVAVALDGPWMGAVAERARQRGVYVALAVTVPRVDERITVTSVLLGPDGRVVATADKQMLMGNERAFLCGGAAPSPVAHTSFGPIGLYSCMDGVTFEVPRTFAVRGARLLVNSLNSFARDEARLHIPVRAAENGVFVAAANKVGPLLPADQIEAFSAALGVPADALHGAGESQIVDPTGTVVARGPTRGEAVIVADIDLSEADPPRPQHRRPEIYAALAQPHTAAPRSGTTPEVTAACVPGARTAPELVHEAIAAGSTLIVLPELTPLPPGLTEGGLPDGVLVVATTLRGDRHIGQIWSTAGLVHEQPQTHWSPRLPHVTGLGDELTLSSTPFGEVAVLVGDDVHHPEVVRLAAIAGAHLVVVCYQPTHGWQCDLAVVERAAENRLAMAVCGPSEPPERSAPPGPPSPTMMLDPPVDSLWNPDRVRPFDGTINTPHITRAGPGDGLLVATLHPGRARSREVSKDTDLVAGRPWQASQVLATPSGQH